MELYSVAALRTVFRDKKIQTQGGAKMKLLIGQFAIIFIVWVGLLTFFQDMSDASKIIFYLVTSWLLLLIVLIIKTWIREKKETNQQ